MRVKHLDEQQPTPLLFGRLVALVGEQEPETNKNCAHDKDAAESENEPMHMRFSELLAKYC